MTTAALSPADRYTSILEPSRARLRDEELLRVQRRVPELEVQARWFAGEFGTAFETIEGAPVKIVQFGVWNREAGPDFAEAAIRIAGETRRGCIELDLEPRDWEAHGHAGNPDYENVVLHVCCHAGAKQFFTRTARNRHVPQIVIDLARIENDPPNPLPAARPGRCTAPLREAGEAKALAVIEGAAQFRLQRKSARLARLAEIQGRDEALFQAVAAGLGYKNNKLPFTILAQRLPARLLLERRNDTPALLFGVSGFLPGADLSQFDRRTRAYLRELWDAWWRLRAGHERLVLDADLWRLGGLRPVNHPQRRVAALVQLLQHWPAVRRFASAPDARQFGRFCTSLSDPYWDHHFTLRSEASPKKMSLIGSSRAADLLANVLFPFAYSEDPGCWMTYRQLPAPLSNRRVETAAVRLFGPAPDRRLVAKVVHQQGLLQIYEDFCMRDASNCACCLFPKQLAKW